MIRARQVIAEIATWSPVPRWAATVFVAVMLAGWLTALAIAAILYDGAHQGPFPAGATVLLTCYPLIVATAVWLLRRAGSGLLAGAETDMWQATGNRQVDTSRQQQDFLTHLHHELRTPVTVVLGATQLLVKHGDSLSPADRQKLREAAYRHARSLSELVVDLTVGMDEALPGLSVSAEADDWSSRIGPRSPGSAG